MMEGDLKLILKLVVCFLLFISPIWWESAHTSYLNNKELLSAMIAAGFASWFGARAAFNYQVKQKKDADFESSQLTLYTLIDSLDKNFSVIEKIYYKRIQQGFLESRKIQPSIPLNVVNFDTVCFVSQGLGPLRFILSGEENKYLMTTSIDAASKINVINNYYAAFDELITKHASVTEECRTIKRNPENAATMESLLTPKMIAASNLLESLYMNCHAICEMSKLIANDIERHFFNIESKLKEERRNELRTAIKKLRFNLIK